MPSSRNSATSKNSLLSGRNCAAPRITSKARSCWAWNPLPAACRIWPARRCISASSSRSTNWWRASKPSPPEKCRQSRGVSSTPARSPSPCWGNWKSSSWSGKTWRARANTLHLDLLNLVVCGKQNSEYALTVLHPFEFFAARDDSAVTLAPEGRQILAQCVSTGNSVKDRRAPERGGRTGDECFFRPGFGNSFLVAAPPLGGAANPGCRRLSAGACGDRRLAHVRKSRLNLPHRAAEPQPNDRRIEPRR